MPYKVTMRKVVLSAALVAAAGLAAMQAAAQSTQAPRHLAYTVPGTENVQVRRDNVYRNVAEARDTVMYGTALRYDVFLPAAAAGRRGGVIFIHGGLVPGNQRISPKDDLPAYREWGRLIAASGMVAVTFSHRLTTDENLDVAASDVEALLKEVRSKAAEWNLDPERMCVAVLSAGGPLSSLFIGENAQPIRCIALYYPFLDTEHTAVVTPFRQAHTPARTAQLARYSPRLKLLAAGQSPPLLLARGGRDAIPGINASIERFVQAALWVNAPLDLYIHPTGPHGFDMVSTPDARSSEIVAATLAFFQKHLQN